MKSAYELRDVTIAYDDGTKVLEHICLSVDYGELVYLTGESGAGKTSVIRTVESSGVRASGTVLFWGKDRRLMTAVEKRAISRELGVVYQDFKLIRHQSVLENVMLPLRWSRNVESSRKMMRERAKKAIRDVGLEGLEFKPAGLLSGGEKQRVAIARVLAKGSGMILADEPTGNLDRENAFRVISILERLAKEGLAVMITTHDLSLIRDHKHYKIEGKTVVRIQ